MSKLGPSSGLIGELELFSGFREDGGAGEGNEGKCNQVVSFDFVKKLAVLRSLGVKI